MATWHKHRKPRQRHRWLVAPINKPPASNPRPFLLVRARFLRARFNLRAHAINNNNMKQQLSISSITCIAVILAILTACESNDMPIQHPDSYDYITFSAQTQKLITRAEPYEDYNPDSHPATMGAFGYYDIASCTNLTPTDASQPNIIFNNEIVSYDATTKTWKNSTKKRWDSYQGATALDFFAYMPQNTGAKVTRPATNTYTLSVPFTMPNDAPFLYDTKAAPVVCEKPINKDITDPEIPFRPNSCWLYPTLHHRLKDECHQAVPHKERKLLWRNSRCRHL
mgnify:CR=1 FL=1